MWGSSFRRLQHRVRSRVSILVIRVIRNDYNDMSQPNAHVICSDKFDVPLCMCASPDTENARLVIGRVGDVVASMIIVTLVSNKTHPVTECFEFPLHRTWFS